MTCLDTLVVNVEVHASTVEELVAVGATTEAWCHCKELRAQPASQALTCQATPQVARDE